MQASRTFFAAAMIALGVTGVVNGDFALVWQNVPAGVPGRTTLAWLGALIELVAGFGLLWSRTTPWASRLLFPFMLLWFVLLAVPPVFAAPLDASSWGGIGEIGAMTAGAWTLFALHAGAWETQHLKFAVGKAGLRGARALLIIALPMLALEVIVAAIPAGDAVMQPWLRWLPWPAGWAILTGIGSLATCLALLFGVWPRLAATLEAAMVILIGLVYWAPDIHTGRTATTAFIITMLVAGGVWLVADTYRQRRWLSVGRDGQPTPPASFAGLRGGVAP